MRIARDESTPPERVTVEPWYRLAVCIVKPATALVFRRDERGQDRLPRTGGCIVAVNHISYADPFVAALFVHDAGRRPRFMGKVSVFNIPVIGRILRGAGQIPVYRESADAAHALSAATDAVRAGECVVIYPEATVTRDPDYWPMSAKTGVARLALATGAPVIPLAQWGAQEFLGRGGKPRLGRRTKVQARAGAPVDLSRWHGRELTAEVLRESTSAIMDALTEVLAEIRGGRPTTERYQPGPEERRGSRPRHQRKSA
ncbi:MAG TPA: lysophospholipid acyltransferase family protein [Mycobacteriales bacterium]|nr:lysophospholipid acyltransferase family protein [Mycobacteriales bacterium]